METPITMHMMQTARRKTKAWTTVPSNSSSSGNDRYGIGSKVIFKMKWHVINKEVEENAYAGMTRAE
jgi:hypothetical protein